MECFPVFGCRLAYETETSNNEYYNYTKRISIESNIIVKRNKSMPEHGFDFLEYYERIRPKNFGINH